MKYLIRTMIGSLCLFSVTACSDNPAQFTGNGKGAAKNVTTAARGDYKALAQKFLLAAQNGDTSAMYEATNITRELVEQSRDKLIHQMTNSLSDAQRREYETALRVSGEIDYFAGMLKKLFPPSAIIQVAAGTPGGSSTDAPQFDYPVTITYGSRQEAPSDKTGQAVREIKLQLHQKSSMAGGRLIHSFSFDSKQFDRLADRDFNVVSYF